MKALSGSNLVPIAIILAGFVLALAVYGVRHVPTPERIEGDITKVLPVGMDDHVRGNPDANVGVIVYSDIDCEYCHRFHEVIEQAVADYGNDVAFVYRHFPIVDLHPYSGTHAKAAECAAALGTPGSFWRFISTLQASSQGSEPFNPQGYRAIAETIGIPVEDLAACAESNRFEDRVARDFENALQIGARGTPFSVILVKGMEPSAISGYVPYDGIQAVLDTALAQTR